MTEQSRRVSKRYNVKWSSRLLLPRKKIVSATTTNISLEGAYVETATGCEKGTAVSVELNPFVAGQSFRLRIPGVVVRDTLLSNNRGVGLGVLFKDITASNQKLLVYLIKNLKS